MKNFDMKKINQAGSLMIEAIAMLGLISLVTPVVYKKSAERMTELQDINAASHMRMLSSALDAYISDNYDTLKGDGNDGKSTLTADKLAKYLPEGAVEGDKVYGPLGEDYKFSYVVKKTDNPKAPVITGYVGANVTDDKITPQRTSRIATMIGGNGAIVDNGDVLGVQGTWQTTPESIKLEDISDNSVVVASQNAVGATAQIDTSKFLYRVEDDVENNTMQTNLYMHDGNSSHSIEGVSQLLIGYQKGRDGNQNGTEDEYTVSGNGSSPDDYALYVNSQANNGNVWIGGELLAMQGRLIVQNDNFNYNPYDADGKGFVVDGTGMYFTVAGNDTDKLYVTEDALTYADNLIVAENGAGDTAQQAVRFFGDSDAAKVSITEDRTHLKNSFIANQSGEFDNNSLNGVYSTLDGTGGRIDIENVGDANVLTGKTYATDLRTGYLTSNRFDAEKLRAGRSNLEESQETWNLDVDEKGVKIGYRRDENGNISTLDNPNYAYINIAGKERMLNGMQTALDGNSTKNLDAGSIHMRARFKMRKPILHGRPQLQDGVAQVDIGSVAGGVAVNVDKGNVNTDVASGNVNTTVTNGNINMVSNGGEVIISNKTGTTNSVTGTTTYNETAHLKLRGDGNADLQGNEYVFIQTNNTGGQQGNVVLQNGALAVSDTRNTSHNKEDNVLSSNATTETAGVYIRRGSIDVNTFSYDANKDGNDRAADAGTGYVKADRFVVENTADNGHNRNPNEVYKSTTTIGSGVTYDHYMVDPAYTSVMHDIKLTSRGGARLSDILPDFINKGIYVTDNSYGEGAKPKETGIKDMSDSVDVSNATSIFASAFLGVVPAPQCPPGYAKVITLTPAGWRMAQIGTLVEDSSANAGNRLYLNESTPMYGDTSSSSDKSIYDMTSKGLIKGDIKAIPAGGGSITIPRIFQQNTWLKSAIKLNTAGAEDTSTGNQYSQSGNFIGWNTYMGFIYPSVLWSHLFDSSKAQGMGGSEAPQLGQGDNKIYWNLFPVDKWSIEGYATVYCYFDRNGLTNGKNGSYFDENMVDTKYNQYSILRNVSQGASKKDYNSGYTNRLNNPKLKYTQEW